MQSNPGSPTKPLLVLIAGPYLSGTDGAPERVAANLARLERQALPIYQRGHLPMIGEMACAADHPGGRRHHGDPVFTTYQYPVARRLLERCDAVLRIEGESRGADQDVARARAMGLPVYHRVEDIPMLDSPADPDAAMTGDTPPMQANPRLRIVDVKVLSHDWYLLKKTTFDYLRRDGTWQRRSRETYDRGNGAAILLFNRQRGTVVLIRQFRLPVYVNGLPDGMLIEACAGLLDGDDPESCIRRESQEETGLRIRSPRKLFEAYMSPGSVTEKLHFFAAEYDAQDRMTAGGGDAGEGEDIEVIELRLEQALDMIGTGQIQDGKTIMLLLHAARVGLDHL